MSRVEAAGFKHKGMDMTRINAKVVVWFTILVLGYGNVSAEIIGPWRGGEYYFDYTGSRPDLLDDYDLFYLSVDQARYEMDAVNSSNFRRTKVPNHIFELIAMMLKEYSLENGDVYTLLFKQTTSVHTVAILITNAKTSGYVYVSHVGTR